MPEYKSREFCKAVRCEVQPNMDKLKKDSPDYLSFKSMCRLGCKKTAWEFHNWLQEQGYSIKK